MNAKTVTDLYKKVLAKNSGVRNIKFDLHIHSPGSSDFINGPELNIRDSYIKILKECKENGIEIIAITDHNTFKGYNKLKEFLDMDSGIKKEYHNILVLCGIEITCFSKHILAIFDEDFSEKSQNIFLHEIGIDELLQGNGETMADEFGPSKLLELIDKNGGIAILAHADNEQGFLHSFCRNKGEDKPELSFNGKSLSKIIKSPYLYGIQIANKINEKKISNVLLNSDYKRLDRYLPYLSFSDSHGNNINGKYSGKSGKQIGSTYSIAKLSYKSFNSIKIALSDPSSRIINKIDSNNRPKISGCSIKSHIIKDPNEEYATFNFHNEMNCIIGARGTGKSTLLSILQNIISFNDKSDFNNRYDNAIVFIEYFDIIYAIMHDTLNDERKIYIKTPKNTFTLYKGDYAFLNLFLTKCYQQRELYDYSLQPDKILDIINDFIMWKNHKEYGNQIQIINQCNHDIKEMFKKHDNEQCYTKSLRNYIIDEDLLNNYLFKYNQVLKANDEIFKMQEEFVSSINKILEGKVILSLSKKLKSNEEFEYLTEKFPKHVANETNRYYDYKMEIKKFMNSIIEKSKIRYKFDFFKLLISEQNDKIIYEYKLQNTDKINSILNDIRNSLCSTDLLLSLDSSIQLEYNVNAGIKGTKPNFRKNDQLSLGQNAVALLLIILSASKDMEDVRPLLMDQPEDDLDNSYIYNTLVENFRRSKHTRQLIISTHNANIPVASDAENILVLKYNGEYGLLDKNGSIDNPKICKDILDILEGGELAFKNRNDKYGL